MKKEYKHNCYIRIYNKFGAIIVTVKTKKESTCTSTKVKLCNGALAVVKELQEKYETEHGGIYLSIPRAINMLLSGIKIEK